MPESNQTSPKEGVSAVVLTYNRARRCRDALTHNMRALATAPSEILLLNNGTERVSPPDPTATTSVRVLDMPRNLGAEARNVALDEARYETLLFLDDDVYIEPEHIARLPGIMNTNPETACVAFRVADRAGGEEASLLPTVFHGCAVAIKREALRRAGGYPRGYRYYAEEYHVAFRLRQEGYITCIRMDCPPVRHVRDASGRSKSHILRLLTRNNTRLFTTFLPWRHWGAAMRDMLQRYRLVSCKEDAADGFRRGLASIPAALVRGGIERRPLGAERFGELALLPRLEQILNHAGSYGRRPLVLCGTGRFPRLWLSEIRRQGWEPVAFLDANTCWNGQCIEQVPVYQNLAGLPDGTGPVYFLTGLSSLAETHAWEARLPEEGFAVSPAGEYFAPVSEKIAENGIVPLENCCRLRLFSRQETDTAKNHEKIKPTANPL